MLKLRVVQAEYGDCLILEYGTAAKPRFLLIDGGPEEIYSRHLRAELQSIHSSGGRLDLMILSHVDRDHVTGLVDFVSELRQQEAAGQPPLIGIGGVWHNSFQQTIENGNNIEARVRAMAHAASANANTTLAATEMDLMGIAEGHKLRTDVLALGLTLNQGFTNSVVLLDSAPGPIQIGNLTLTVVGPTQKNLDALRKEWIAWLDKHENAIASGDPFVAGKADTSKPNLSSIMLLAEANGKSLLLTGDGRGDHLTTGLKQAGRLSAAGKFHVDTLKMPHHGSDRNVTKKFLANVTADNYVISANGKDDNPDLATLIWLVETAKQQKRKITIHVTNSTPSTEKLKSEYKPATYGYKLKVMNSNAHAMLLSLAN